MKIAVVGTGYVGLAMPVCLRDIRPKESTKELT